MPTRILVVDDCRAIRHSLRSYIEAQTDWQICGEAENGKAAVEMTQTLSPDVVILDLSMPVMNGQPVKTSWCRIWLFQDFKSARVPTAI